MNKYVGVLIDGELTVHAQPSAAGGDFHTLCAVDANDDSVGHGGVVDVPRGKKIDCPHCRDIWEAAKQLRATDFE